MEDGLESGEMRKNILRFILFQCAFGCMVWAADLTGKWTGTIDVYDAGSGNTTTTRIELNLTQQGADVAGKIGRPNDPDAVSIRNGETSGAKLTFEASNEETAGPVHFTLTVNGDHMDGEMTGAIPEGKISGKVKLSREK